VCDLETSWMRRPWPTGGCRAKKTTCERAYWFALAVNRTQYQVFEDSNEPSGSLKVGIFLNQVSDWTVKHWRQSLLWFLYEVLHSHY